MTTASASDETLDDVVARALEAYADLEGLAESIEDEWTYVTDLEAAWRERIEGVAERRGSEAAGPAVIAAVDAAIAEITLIQDPHRAIDWLSTFPQIVLLAVGEAP